MEEEWPGGGQISRDADGGNLPSRWHWRWMEKRNSTGEQVGGLLPATLEALCVSWGQLRGMEVESWLCEAMDGTFMGRCVDWVGHRRSRAQLDWVLLEEVERVDRPKPVVEHWWKTTTKLSAQTNPATLTQCCCQDNYPLWPRWDYILNSSEREGYKVVLETWQLFYTILHYLCLLYYFYIVEYLL